MRIIFVHSGTALATFERNDIAILESIGEVQSIHWLDLLQLCRSVPKCDLIFRWFADMPAWLACRMGRWYCKPVIVVAGGFDVVEVPEVSYGLGHESLIDRVLTTRMRDEVLRKADSLLCVSEFALKCAKARGASHPNLIYNGVDPEAFHFHDRPHRLPRVITTSFLHPKNMIWKGLTTFVQAAASVQRQLPSAEFMVLGQDMGAKEILLRTAVSCGAHIQVKSIDSRAAYRSYLAASSIYVQASVNESFGLALAEAMLCGCWPVITSRGALPEVVGPVGQEFPYGDSEVLASILLQRIQHDIDELKRQECRDRIVAHFSLQRRREAIRRIIGQVTDIAD